MGFFSSLFGGGDAPQDFKRVSSYQPTFDPADLPADVVQITATDGPMMEHRERLRHLRASGVTTPRIALSRTSQVEEELIELVEMEIAELCVEVGFPHPPVIERMP